MRPAPFWPAVVVTFIAGLAFAGLKVVLIGEIAFDFDPATHQPLPIAWMEQVLQACIARGTLREAVSQGLAATLTLGVLLGYLLNAPLAGAWRARPLFMFSLIGMILGVFATGFLNPWVVAVCIGVVYGTTCAARGKVVPLYAMEGGRSNTLVSGIMNAILVVGLLVGVVSGSQLYDKCDDSVFGQYGWFNLLGERWWRRIVLAVILGIGIGLALRITPRETHTIPFRTGLGDLIATSKNMFRRYWALLIAGGIIWGIASAASLAGMIYAVDDLHIPFDRATTLVAFPAIGAIIGNLISHWLDRRRYVIGTLVAMAAAVGLFPLISVNVPTAAVMMVLIGLLFAAPTNVLDAKLLANAAAEGDPGKGSTSMSLWHNVFILGIGAGLALPLFLGWMTAAGQFYFLGAMTLVAAVITGFTNLSRSGGTVIDAEPIRK